MSASSPKPTLEEVLGSASPAVGALLEQARQAGLLEDYSVQAVARPKATEAARHEQVFAKLMFSPGCSALLAFGRKTGLLIMGLTELSPCCQALTAPVSSYERCSACYAWAPTEEFTTQVSELAEGGLYVGRASLEAFFSRRGEPLTAVVQAAELADLLLGLYVATGGPKLEQDTPFLSADDFYEDDLPF